MDEKLTDELSSDEIDPDDETVVHDLHVGEKLGCERKKEDGRRLSSTFRGKGEEGGKDELSLASDPFKIRFEYSRR